MGLEIEAGAPQQRIDLAAQIRNGACRSRVGGRGEQAYDAQLAGQPSVRIEALDPDVVEICPPVHARLHVGLGDDQRLRLGEERADFRRNCDDLTAALEHRHVVAAQDAETRLLHRSEIGVRARHGVIAHPEQREIVGGQPFQELDRFGEIVHRQRRRMMLDLGDDRVDAGDHRPPVLDAQLDLGQDGLQRLHNLGAARGIVDALDVNVDEALAPAAVLGAPLHRQAGELAARIALHDKDRVRYQADFEPAFDQFAHDRIDQERHVVIDHLDHRDGFQTLSGTCGRRLETDLALARLAMSEERPGGGRELRQFRRLIANHVFRRRAPEQQPEQACRHVIGFGAEQAARGVDHGAGVLIAAGDQTRRGLWRGARIVHDRHADCNGFARQRKRCRLAHGQ